MNRLKVRRLLEDFFIEDIGDQDVTSDFLFPEDAEGELHFVSKQSGIFCGSEIIREGYQLLDPSIMIELYTQDGTEVGSGECIAAIQGPIVNLLKGERVILNLIQRMSGIATNTKRAVETLNNQETKICDTRKTTPGLRMFEKYAVRMGGGVNHRYGLYDAVMLKDNHIAFAGSILKAVEIVRAKLGHMVKIEVETETEAQVKEAVQARADCIMFDNRSPEEISTLVKFVPSHITTEASGGIHLNNLAAYRESGVDYISLGALTHSATSLDISANVSIKQRRPNYESI
ncbi:MULTISPECIES: carboxylating nicotinate-nucleotide diphosphorylase [Halobacillus]|uniref:Probable nicotinate-nucleotide pyrophosphorylase [carboxylating] n=1 Tax=Halobacillus halophilus (strain ATCC 35676 / DSM 2266 / JCM 20832 / KCTC 3685 / LMG 17431 / NBRC 102448 / NCIMB 2269) TaxID=866895 RepID=I0JHK2_HALH3|nr:carboxylating nicotinate-nucleotide diphosphorylase [Halobacillus halophilus]ASF37841.1 nicotinate-nucleotide diphosphorylase (carboxylating) [Halobacillus halophilus]CCG43620.1 nicotinate-nucleotide pyrophosphorylase [Halobacillus halophilus DSM 2266]